MEDLADEECVVQIFIRCPEHLYGDEKFGQIGGGGDLAGDRRRGAGRRTAASAAGRPWRGTSVAAVRLPTSVSGRAELGGRTFRWP
jgi:hypothetical protein